jgi:hypothetical protein
MSEETKQLEAGPELDRLVAEKMGYEWLELEGGARPENRPVGFT